MHTCPLLNGLAVILPLFANSLRDFRHLTGWETDKTAQEISLIGQLICHEDSSIDRSRISRLPNWEAEAERMYDLNEDEWNVFMRVLPSFRERVSSLVLRWLGGGLALPDRDLTLDEDEVKRLELKYAPVKFYIPFVRSDWCVEQIAAKHIVELTRATHAKTIAISGGPTQHRLCNAMRRFLAGDCPPTLTAVDPLKGKLWPLSIDYAAPSRLRHRPWIRASTTLACR